MIITATGILTTTLYKNDPVAKFFAVTEVKGVTPLEKRILALPKQFVLAQPAEGSLPPSERGSLTRQQSLSVKKELYLKDTVDFRTTK